MIGVGQKFPLYTLNCVDLNNEMVEVDTWSEVDGEWLVIYFLPQRLYFYMSDRDRGYGYTCRTC
jgi:alkyl hydroperoxide reductase subunit AhpC